VRRLRGVLVAALIWAIVWLPLGLALPWLRRRPPDQCVYCPPGFVIRFLTLWTLWGALSGAIFAVVLAIAERRHTLAELSFARVAVWGAIGSLALPAALTILDVVRATFPSERRFVLIALGIAAALGAGCAAGTLALARRAAT
jgi:hypothetical protein